MIKRVYSRLSRRVEYISNPAELLAATTLFILGIFILAVGSSLRVGSLRSMGPGAIPVALGVVILVLSFLLLLSAGKQQAEPQAASPSITGAVASLLGMVLWAVVAPRFGMIPATLLLVVVSSLAYRPIRPVTIAINAVVLSLLGAALFVYGLSIPLQAMRM